MKTLDELLQFRETVLKELKVVDDAISSHKSKTVVQCTSSVLGSGCGMGMIISDLVYIQTHWYERPYGCTGGAQWHPGEGQFECPHCGCRNRLYDRPDIMKLKSLFKKVVKEHDEQT